MDEFRDAGFILTGSSERKLRRAGVDLLAGRAIERRLRPYLYQEMAGAFNLDTAPLDHSTRGRAFEHFIIAETQWLLDYRRSGARKYYWRTSAGAEVDCVIEKHGTLIAGCGKKSSPVIHGPHTSGLRALAEEHPEARLLVVCTVERPYSIKGIEVVPWQRYLEGLRTMAGE